MGKEDQVADTVQVVEELREVETELQAFEDKQTSVTRTLQLIVYPAMVAFIILAAYGFYLVQALTTDVHRLTETIAIMQSGVNKNMNSIAGTMATMNQQMNSLVTTTQQMSNNLQGMQENTRFMTGSVGQMTDSTRLMSGSIDQMNDNTRAMTANIQQMNASTQNMAVSTYTMQRDMWQINKNISGPMKMFNTFNPFKGDNITPYVVPPPTTPYYTWSYGTPVQQPVWGSYPVDTGPAGSPGMLLPNASESTTPVLESTATPAITPSPDIGNGPLVGDNHNNTDATNNSVIPSSTQRGSP